MFPRPTITIIASILLIIFIVFGSQNSFGTEMIDAKVFTRDKKIWISGMTRGRAKLLINAEIRRFYGVSKDGKIIYTVQAADSNGKDDIYLHQIGKEPRRIMQIDPGMNVNISPDGSKLVLSVYRKGGTILDLLTNKQTPIIFVPFDEKYRQASLKGTRKFEGDWDWHWDNNFTWSEDGKLMAFRRCSGDLDKPACLTFLLDMTGNGRPVVVAEDLAQKSLPMQNHVPVGFVGNKLFIWTQADLYSYDLATKTSSFSAADAWSATLSPDGKSVAFINGANTKGGANLWSINLASGKKSRLTNFNNIDIHGCSIRWGLDSKTIYFGWQTADLKNEPAWSINSDGSGMKEIREIGLEEYKISIPAAFIQSP